MTKIQKILFVLIVVALSTLADQLHKFYMLEIVHIEQKGRITVFPFLDLVMVWNKGVSYGLFASNSPFGTYMLLAITGSIISVLFAFVYYTTSWFQNFCYCLIIGGALGNFIDRLRLGAVADFFSFHAWGYYWYVFNIADILITIGIILLIFHNFFISNTHEND